jgi:hypothetical protein
MVVVQKDHTFAIGYKQVHLWVNIAGNLLERN